MSVQDTTPSTIPSRVRVDPLATGRQVVARVVDWESEATTGTSIHDVLTVDVGGSTYRVDAADAEAYPPSPSDSRPR